MDRPTQVKVHQRRMVQRGKKSRYQSPGDQVHYHQIMPRSVDIWTPWNQQNDAIGRARLLVAKDEVRRHGFSRRIAVAYVIDTQPTVRIFCNSYLLRDQYFLLFS